MLFSKAILSPTFKEWGYHSKEKETEKKIMNIFNIAILAFMLNTSFLECGKIPIKHQYKTRNPQKLTKNTKTWIINWQDVLRIGKSLASGNFCNENYVSLCVLHNCYRKVHLLNLKKLHFINPWFCTWFAGTGFIKKPPNDRLLLQTLISLIFCLHLDRSTAEQHFN